MAWVLKECGQGQLNPLPTHLLWVMSESLGQSLPNYTPTLPDCHLDRGSLSHQIYVWFFCNQPSWKLQKDRNNMFSFAMLRYVFNLAFSTTATNIQWHPLSLLLLPGSSSALAALLQPGTAAMWMTATTFIIRKRESGSKQGKKHQLAALPGLLPCLLLFSDWVKLVTNGACREKRSAGKGGHTGH